MSTANDTEVSAEAPPAGIEDGNSYTLSFWYLLEAGFLDDDSEDEDFVVTIGEIKSNVPFNVQV